MKTSAYLLDTNAYALLFDSTRPPSLSKLEELIKIDGITSFYIPQIVSMEIYSVLGKYRRGGNHAQNIQCDRQVVGDTYLATCTHTYMLPARKRMKPKVFRDLQKMIKDIEAGKGDVKAAILSLGTEEFITARQLLVDHADQYPFGSHDALVAASALVAKANGTELTLVTSDKGLKAVCLVKGLAVFDPSK